MAEPSQAFVFDAYGTLFDVHSVAVVCDELFPGQGRELSQLWRSKQLEYTWLRSLMGRYEDFELVTRAALTYACRSLGLRLQEVATQQLMVEYRRLALYPEILQALRALRGRRLAILSNGSPGMLQALVENAGLTEFFEQVLSVDQIKIFKPHPSVYQLAVDRLGVSKESIAFISSNYWDVTGAASFGFKSFWINRSGAQADELGLRPAGVFGGLDELSAALS